MSRIVWLASYPKSGNTWVRAFLNSYCQQATGAAVPLPPGESWRLSPSACSRVLFDHWSCVESSDLTDDEAELLRADVYRAIANACPAPVFLKVHDAWTLDRLGRPLFPADVTAAAIYIVRNPLDVAVSFAYHLDRSASEIVSQMCRENVTLGVDTRLARHQLPQRLLSWSGHVRSWLRDSGLRLTLVRFEDLLLDPASCFTRIVLASGLDLVQAHLASALEATTFKRLQAREQSHDFPERLSRTTPFFRSGRAGSWRAELSADDVARLVAAHGQMMSALGYVTPDAAPVF